MHQEYFLFYILYHLFNLDTKKEIFKITYVVIFAINIENQEYYNEMSCTNISIFEKRKTIQ